MGLGVSKAELAEILRILIDGLDASPGEYKINQMVKLNDAIRRARELEQRLERKAIEELPDYIGEKLPGIR